MARFIFVTGGVVSSLGKGLASASLASLLQHHGYKVRIRKLDPYLNVDPGTMSPYQHGEVYVTDDGAETDLDLGHYERFSGVSAKKSDNITTGKIYSDVLKKERKGEYLGKTVQVIPHITDRIKQFIKNDSSKEDFVICEIGGIVGDIESLPFVEAIRQFANDVGKKNALFIHLTLVPYLKASDEIKTKPTQHSVKELRSIGIQPDILICRSEKMLPNEQKHKIALFTNVPDEAIISAFDVDDLYKIPEMMHGQGFDDIVVRQLNLDLPPANLNDWRDIVLAKKNPKNTVNIAMVGKYVELRDSYISLTEALLHGGIHTNTRVNIHYFESQDIEENNADCLKNMDCIVIPGGFGDRGIEGKIKSVQFSRENNIPYLGICLGLQVAVIEISRNLAKLRDAHSTEFDSNTPHPVIALITEWQPQSGEIQERDETSDLGGTMRLGAQEIHLSKNTLAAKTYNSKIIKERHRHRYEVNNNYRSSLEKIGICFSGLSVDDLVEIIELTDHPWFFASQFHPEFTSNPRDGHPLFKSFIMASHEHSKSKGE